MISDARSSSQAQGRPTGQGTQRPSLGALADPTTVDLRTLSPNTDVQSPGKAFLHPGGLALLDEEKADATLRSPRVTAQPAAGTLTPSLGVGFQGIRYEESSCGCYPPDGAIAAGPNHVVAAVNTAFKIWNKSGALLAGPISLGSLFATNPSCLRYVSDPFADYDGTAGHFVLGALTYDSTYNSSICIAVSKTGDPTGLWYVYGFSVTPSRNLLDFPHIAIGSDAIYLAGNQFLNGNSFNGARVYAYNKTAMYSGGGASSVFVDVGNTASGILSDTLYPARAVGVSGTMYFIGADNCNCSKISLWKWTTPFSTPTSFTLEGGVDVTPYTQPPDALQKGGSGLIPTNDTRTLGAQWYNGTVYGTHAIGCDPGGGTVACVQWYQLSNIDGAPSLVQQGIVSGSGQYRFYPNLSVDSAGDLSLGYAYSSSSDYAGISYTSRLAGDTPGTTQAEVVLKAGETTVIYNGRYGDYMGDVVDPDGCTIWHFGEYATTSSSVWGTWVGSFRFATCAGASTPTPTVPLNVTATSTATRTPTGTVTPTRTPTLTPVPATATPTPLTCAAPTITSASDSNPLGGGTVSFTWNPVAGATQYKIQRQRSDGSWQPRQTSSATSFTGSDSFLDPLWRVFVSAGSCAPLPGPATVFNP